MQYIGLAVVVIILVALSAVFSGLNIAFMSLPRRDLRHKAKLGELDALRVLPLREQSHLTLAAILYANVASVTTTGLVLDSVTGGLIAGFASTILLVIFGEILPQAYATRLPLRFCAFFAPFLRGTVIVTYIFAKPTAILLDRVMPRAERPLRNRDELGLLIRDYKGPNTALDDDEVEIIQGALQLSEKQISEIMTPLERVFYLREDQLVDQQLIQQIQDEDYSRIPVFDSAGLVFRGVLLMKDMINIDFSTHPRPVRELRIHPGDMIGSRTALDTMFRKFLSSPSHLAAVERDDQVVGILTIEDLIEEIVGHEIVDEADRDHHRR